MTENSNWIVQLVENPTKQGVLELASSLIEIAEAYDAVVKEYEAYIDEELLEAEETEALLEKAAKVLQERKIEHRYAVAAIDTIREGLGIEKGTVKEVAGRIEELFVPKSKIDKRIGELIDDLLEMQTKKGRVDILTRLVTIQKIKLCARGELVEKKK